MYPLVIILIRVLTQVVSPYTYSIISRYLIMLIFLVIEVFVTGWSTELYDYMCAYPMIIGPECNMLILV